MTLKEHIDDIRDNLEKGIYVGEAAVSQGIVLRLLDALTWPRYNTQVIIPEYSVGGRRVDFALCHPPSKPIVFIEVKQVGNIEGAEQQLFEYAFHEGVPIAILTDGRVWRFFHPTAQGDYGERTVCELNLSEGNSEESAERLNRYLNYESIRTGEAVMAIAEDYRQRQIETSLPKAWTELVEEKTEFLLNAIAEKVANLCRYTPESGQVLDFLRSLKIEPKPDNGNGGNSTWHPGLLVTVPNGEVINHKVSAVTFVEVIEKLGIERVRALNKKDIIPLISTDKHNKYKQGQSGRYYIMTNNSTLKKQKLLEEIASELPEPLLKVEIVKKSSDC